MNEIEPIPKNLDADTNDEANDEDAQSMPQHHRVSCDDSVEPCNSIDDIQRIYIRFLVQLREEYLLPKKIISVISSNIVSLLEGLHTIIQKQSKPVSSHTVTTDSIPCLTHLIEPKVLTNTIHGICQIIESTTRSEYEFMNLCKRFMNYQPPHEVLLSSPEDVPEYGYFVPIADTLAALLSHGDMLHRISVNVDEHRRTVRRDDDLMLSLRDGNFGVRLDDESFLIQLYVDDIGLTNPIGPRKDRHKMTMVYFLLEDIPDKFRSLVHSINLFAIAPSKSLKA
jgi:hypothetical protein